MIEAEEWRQAPGFDGYEVSSFGRVRRVAGGRGARVGRILAVDATEEGYSRVGPYRGGRAVKIKTHRLVAAAFLGPRLPGMEVNHIDGDKMNARLSNLEYVTPAENMAHAVRNGLRYRVLGDNEVRTIRDLCGSGVYQSEVAARFGVSQSTVSGIATRKSRRGAA